MHADKPVALGAPMHMPVRDSAVRARCCWHGLLLDGMIPMLKPGCVMTQEGGLYPQFRDEADNHGGGIRGGVDRDDTRTV